MQVKFTKDVNLFKQDGSKYWEVVDGMFIV
jgi:hypothetical protein